MSLFTIYLVEENCTIPVLTALQIESDPEIHLFSTPISMQWGNIGPGAESDVLYYSEKDSELPFICTVSIMQILMQFNRV